MRTLLLVFLASSLASSACRSRNGTGGNVSTAVSDHEPEAGPPPQQQAGPASKKAVNMEDLKEVEGLEPVEGAELPPLPPGLMLRYQSIYMGAGAAGNVRFRIRDDGAVFLQRNGLGDFAPPKRWEADYPATPSATLDDAVRKQIADLLAEHDFFSFASGYTSVRGMDGGVMEILEVRAGDREHRVIVDRGEHPGFSAIRDALLQLIYDAGGG